MVGTAPPHMGALELTAQCLLYVLEVARLLPGERVTSRDSALCGLCRLHVLQVVLAQSQVRQLDCSSSSLPVLSLPLPLPRQHRKLIVSKFLA